LSKTIDELIAGAKQQIEQVEPEDVKVLMGEDLVTVRIWPLTGQAYRALVADHPARLVEVDGQKVVGPGDKPYECNIDSLTRAYPRVALVQDDEETDLTAELWGRILDVLSPAALEGVMATIAYVNVAVPAQNLISALGKASAGGKRTKRS
jgi:hypothetical protein